jgi:antitoxin (DNA-binding transcriptional repressor) of toxin-antitoxin stability system
MTATLEQIQSDLLGLIALVERGEEVVIIKQGRAVAKLCGVGERGCSAKRRAWLARLAELRQQVSTGRTGLTVEQLLDEDRGD